MRVLVLGAGFGGLELTTRLSEALDLVRSRRRSDGTWQLDAEYADDVSFTFGEVAGGPSRWITLRALRVLRWAEPA